MDVRPALSLTFTWFVAAVLTAPGCLAQSRPESDPATIRAIYDSAFAYVESALPEDAGEQASPYWPVWALARFRQQSVGWAELHGEAYTALTGGPMPCAWLVVVPEGTPARARMVATLQLDPATDLLVAQIAPIRITVPWAGVVLWRQLSLLADYALGASASPPTDEEYFATEFRGYQVELMVADLLSGGLVRLVLDDLLAQGEVTGVESLTDLTSTIVELPPALEAVLPAPAAASQEEVWLRGGFAIAALVIRYCEQRGLDASTALPVMQALFPRPGASGESAP